MGSLTDEIRKKLQLERMIFHIASCLLIGFTYLFAQPTRTEALMILIPTTGVFFLLDVARLFIPKWREFCISHYDVLMRSHEEKSLSAVTWNILGVLLAVYFFPRELAAAAILFAGIVDPIARLVGVLYGKIQIGTLKKTVAGVVGGALAGLVMAASITTTMSVIFPRLTFGVLALGSMSASICELFAGKLDNLLIPLGSAGTMLLFI
ncbi:MAG: hypothetical protein CMI52_03300 [Parcubacteria group bacterium]|nr:hypothetical protein [Parcubacteria group bacterium]